MENSLSDAQSPFHSPGQGFDFFVSVFLKIYFLQKYRNPLFPEVFFQTGENPQVIHGFIHCHIGIHGKVLREIAGHLPDFCPVFHRDAAYLHSASLFLLECGQNFHQSSFPRSVSAQQAEHSLRDCKVHMVQNVFFPIVFV